MAAGDVTPGRRIVAIRTDEGGKKWYGWPQAGDYWLDENVGSWSCRPPGSSSVLLGNLSNHQVVEHEDGTITVSPSILIETADESGPHAWHGYLERGVWREV